MDLKQKCLQQMPVGLPFVWVYIPLVAFRSALYPNCE